MNLRLHLPLSIILFSCIQVARLSDLNIVEPHDSPRTSLSDVSGLPKHNTTITTINNVIVNATEGENEVKDGNIKSVNQIPIVDLNLSNTPQVNNFKQLSHIITPRESSVPCEPMVLTYGPIGFSSALDLISDENKEQNQRSKKLIRSVPAQIDAAAEDRISLKEETKPYLTEDDSLFRVIRSVESLKRNLDVNRLTSVGDGLNSEHDLYEEQRLRGILKKVGDISTVGVIQSSVDKLDNTDKPCPKQPKFVDKISIERGISGSCGSTHRPRGIDTKYAQEHFNNKLILQELESTKNDTSNFTLNEGKDQINKGVKSLLEDSISDNKEAILPESTSIKNDTTNSTHSEREDNILKGAVSLTVDNLNDNDNEGKVLGKRYIAEWHPMPETETEDELKRRQEQSRNTYLQLAANSHMYRDKPEHEIKQELCNCFNIWPKDSREWFYPGKPLVSDNNVPNKFGPPIEDDQLFYPSPQEDLNFQLEVENDHHFKTDDRVYEESYYPVDIQNLLVLPNYDMIQIENNPPDVYNQESHFQESPLQDQDTHKFTVDVMRVRDRSSESSSSFSESSSSFSESYSKSNNEYIELKPTEMLLSPHDSHEHVSVIWKKPQKFIPSVHRIVQNKNFGKQKTMKVRSRTKTSLHKGKNQERKTISSGHSRRTKVP